MSTRTRPIALVVTALLAACGDSVVGPAGSQRLDIAQVFREMTVPGVSALSAVSGGVAAPVPASLPTPGSCSYAAVSQSFVCPTISANGLTVTQSYSLFNAAGTPLSTFDSASISSVRLRGATTGTTSANGDTFTIEAVQDQTLSGLQGTAHTLTGTNTMNVTGTLKTGLLPGPFSMRSTTTIANLVILANAAAGSYPSSGTVSVVQTNSFTGAPTQTSRVFMTYNGTSTAQVTVTIEGRTVTSCTINLAATVPACG